MADCQGNCDVFKSSFRGREVIYPGPFGEMTAGGDKQYPGRLLASEHPRLRHGGQGHRRGQPGQGHLPGGRHHRRLRSHEPGAHEDAGLHRGSGLHRHRPQVLGSLRHRRRHLRHLAGGGRERLRYRSGGRVLQRRPHQALARDGAPGQDLQGVAGRIRRHHRPAQRRGHRLRRGRIRGREARGRDHRAQVGPGSQVHRR